MKKGELSFEITDEPNVNANPLPNHVGAKWERRSTFIGQMWSMRSGDVVSCFFCNF